MYVVLEKGGFLTIKKKEVLQSTDTIICEGDEKTCNDIIHGKRRTIKR